MADDFDFNSLSKGKLSLAEALKEIGTVKTAFQKAERIEKKLHYHDSVLLELKNLTSNLSPFEYVNSKLDENNSKIENILRQKFEEFNSQYLFQLNEKVSVRDLENYLSQKVTWAAFNNFSQQMNALKSRVEKHILSEFEGFKTKMKLELSKKANEKRAEDDVSMEEIHQLKNRITSLEQKYHDMFMEEGLDESDDYDSQEEMDNMMDDIDRAALREKEDSDDQNEEENEVVDSNPKLDVPGTPTTQNSDLTKGIPTPFTSPLIVSPENINSETNEKQALKTSEEKNLEKQSEKISEKLPDKAPEKVKEKFENSQPKVKEEKKDPEQASKIIEKTIEKPFEKSNEKPIEKPSEKSAEKSVEKSLEKTVGKESPKVPISEKVVELMIPEKKIIPESPSQGEEPTTLKPASRAKNSIEIDSSEQQISPKHQRKGSSRNDNQTLSRKNSMVSSRSGTNQGGGGPNNMRQVNKKITSLQKEIENYKIALDESKQTLLEYQEELARAYEKITEVRMECQNVEAKRQGMEISFIKALRRNGIDKKLNKQNNTNVVSNINAQQMKKIKKEIDEKSKKIISISSYVEKIAADTMHMKDTQKNRINEVINYVKHIDEERQNMKKEFSSIMGTVKQLEGDLKLNIATVQKEVNSIQGPILDLISEQQRENQILNEDIKTHKAVINEVIEDISAKKLYTPKENVRKRNFGVPPSTASPDLSLKYQLGSAKNGNRRTSAKTCDNWLELIPDGTQLVLPRIRATSPFNSKKRSL